MLWGRSETVNLPESNLEFSLFRHAEIMDESRLVRACLQAALRRDFDKEAGISAEWIHSELQGAYPLDRATRLVLVLSLCPFSY